MSQFDAPASPAAPRPASTILLIKEPADVMEVFMVVRHHQIDTASGALVFPGGKVDDNDDSEALKPFIDDKSLKGADLGFKVAAIREAFEETGVLFAKQTGSENLIKAEQLQQLEHYRDKLVTAEISLPEMLEKEGLVLACNELTPYAHWITPEVAPKRFDTQFYVARAPEDQTAIHDGSESVESVWIAAAKALAEADEGKWKIVFPTRMNLEKLAGYSNFQQLKENLEADSVVTVLPFFTSEATSEGEKQFLCVPEEAGYPESKIPIEKVM